MGNTDDKSGSANTVTSASLGLSSAATKISAGDFLGHRAPGPALEPGTVLAQRYEILQLLGEGGMGAVYKARDRELDRIVALKTIRPEMAASPAVAQRFKQELILARQITHRNVVRIYDLGEDNGIKFITMEFVEGRDLDGMLQETPQLPVETAIDIMTQVGAALEAAHAEGVVHRDLKPGNIMCEAGGRVVVMDFGLARSLESQGLTQTGALVGTLEYMSPEQAKGQDLDGRSDIFTFGLIFYEMLTGTRPFKAESAIASLMKRSQERAAPPSTINGAIPRELNALVVKCLEPDPANRYQSADELVDALERFHGRVRSRVRAGVAPAPPGRHWPRLAFEIAAVVVLLVLATWFVRSRSTKAPLAQHEPVSVLVADFANNTGEGVFDDTLEPMFNVALEGASFLNAFNRGQARKLALKLPKASDRLDQETARLVAVSKGIPVVVTGSLTRSDNGYKIAVQALDARTGNRIASPETTVKTKDDVLPAVPKLVAPIRKALGDSTPASVQLEKAGGAFTAASLEAVHQYSAGMEQQFAGKTDEALRSFGKAVELDPGFARAYAGMAGVAIKMAQLQEADKYIKLAMEHVDRMTDRERYRVRGLYYLTAANWQKCAEEFDELVKRYPGDNIGHNNLAVCLSQTRNLTRAVEEARQDLKINPNASAAANLSLFSSYSGDFPGGERAARDLLQSYPSFPFGHLTLALAQLGQGKLTEASESYRNSEKLGPLGASFAASGLGDLALYEGRYADAIRAFEQGAAGDLAAKNPDSAGEKLTALAYAQLWLGKKGLAVQTADKALVNSKAVKIRFLAAQVYVEAGQSAKAQPLAASLAQELPAEAQAYAKIIEGEGALGRKDAHQAIKSLTEANNLLDSWIGRFELGRAYLEAGAFAEADSEFDRCIRRRGEALALFFDLVPTYGYFPAVYYYQGRVREGLKSSGFGDSYRTYLDIRGKAGEDPLLAEVRQRAAR